MMAHSEMRDGNVPAKEGNARVLWEVLEWLPGGGRVGPGAERLRSIYIRTGTS